MLTKPELLTDSGGGGVNPYDRAPPQTLCYPSRIVYGFGEVR